MGLGEKDYDGGENDKKVATEHPPDGGEERGVSQLYRKSTCRDASAEAMLPAFERSEWLKRRGGDRVAKKKRR